MVTNATGCRGDDGDRGPSGRTPCDRRENWSPILGPFRHSLVLHVPNPMTPIAGTCLSQAGDMLAPAFHTQTSGEVGQLRKTWSASVLLVTYAPTGSDLRLSRKEEPAV